LTFWLTSEMIAVDPKTMTSPTNDPCSIPEERNLEPALSQFINSLDVSGLNPGTVAGYKTSLRQFTEWLNATNCSIARPDQLTPSVMHKYRDYLTFRRWCRGTREHKLVALRRFLRYLEAEQVVPNTLAASITSPNLGRLPSGHTTPAISG
jgi:site-specific recombinase XerD